MILLEVNLLTFSKHTMAPAEQNPGHLDVRQLVGRELARVGDLTNSKGEEHYWEFEHIMQLTGCASIGLTTGVAMCCVFHFLHRKFLRSD